MKPFVLFAAVFALTACATKSVWTVAQTDLYRVSNYLSDDSSCEPTASASHKPSFLIKKVVGSSSSAIFKDIVQYQVVWCDSQSSCTDRDYSLQIDQFRNSPENNRTSFESGKNCSIIKHSLSGDRITIESSTYTSNQFSPEECEAAVTAPLPSKFVCISSRIITGQLVQLDRR